MRHTIFFRLLVLAVVYAPYVTHAGCLNTFTVDDTFEVRIEPALECLRIEAVPGCVENLISIENNCTSALLYFDGHAHVGRIGSVVDVGDAKVRGVTVEPGYQVSDVLNFSNSIILAPTSHALLEYDDVYHTITVTVDRHASPSDTRMMVAVGALFLLPIATIVFIVQKLFRKKR